MLICWAVLGGFVLDAIFGDPAWLPHPVVLMGKAITALEKRLRAQFPQTPQGELCGGAVLAAMGLLVLGGVGILAGGALILIAVCIVSCVGFEYLWNLLMKKQQTVNLCPTIWTTSSFS